MNNEQVKQPSKTNLCASVGFLLTLLNLAVSVSFIITESIVPLLIFSSVTATFSLVICICGNIIAKRTGKGRFLSVTGIVLNVLILAALVTLLGMLYFHSCNEVG